MSSDIELFDGLKRADEGRHVWRRLSGEGATVSVMTRLTVKPRPLQFVQDRDASRGAG